VRFAHALEERGAGNGFVVGVGDDDKGAAEKGSEGSMRV
jgi:hypothetical protein